MNRGFQTQMHKWKETSWNNVIQFAFDQDKMLVQIPRSKSHLDAQKVQKPKTKTAYSSMASVNFQCLNERKTKTALRGLETLFSKTAKRYHL